MWWSSLLEQYRTDDGICLAESPIGKENERSGQACLVATESTQTKLNVPTKLLHSLPPVILL